MLGSYRSNLLPKNGSKGLKLAFTLREETNKLSRNIKPKCYQHVSKVGKRGQE